jgi:2-polyprenyl-6-methoxyphenol hydroxylase-like FAD-dependent oxidoreductase
VVPGARSICDALQAATPGAVPFAAARDAIAAGVSVSDADAVVTTVEELGASATGYIVPHWETVVKRSFPLRAQFLVGADGYSSLVRQRLGIEHTRVAGPEYFAAYEFEPAEKVEDAHKDLMKIPGIGEATAERLFKAGLKSVAMLASADTEQLAAIPGVGEKTAAMWLEEAVKIIDGETGAVKGVPA